MRLIFISIFSLFFSVSSFTQLEWPDAPKDKYGSPQKFTHPIDFVYLDVTDWEKYCSLDKYKTNQEIPARITYFTKNGDKVFSSTVGIRLSGIFIRKLPQKSIAVDFSKKKWGSSKVNYPLFPTRDYDDVDSFVLRAHGNPLHKTYFKDAVINESLDQYTNLVYSAYRPVIVYINGDYQGLFNLREKKNKDLLSNLFEIKKKDLVAYDVNGGVLGGKDADWQALMNFVDQADFSSPADYKKIQEKIDLNDLIDYHLAHVFFANTDWPKANVKVWKQTGGKWRYIFFDCDRCYNTANVNFNSLEHLVGENQWAKMRRDNKKDPRLQKSSKIIRKLMENKEFSDQLVLRYQDLLNTVFATPYQIKKIEEAKEKIYPEVQNHIDRWLQADIDANVYQHITDLDNYNQNVQEMLNFAKRRPNIQRKQLDEKFNLGGFVPLKIGFTPSQSGTLKINTVLIDDPNFEGQYFNNLKITIQAIPNEGYEFVAWKGNSSKKSKIEVYPKDLKNGLTAIFKKL